MAKQNLNYLSPFLVNKQKEGAEKALIKITAALVPELQSFFSPIIGPSEPQQTLRRS
jgi:hypothetical protein